MLSLYCSVDVINELITSYVLKSEESWKKKQKIHEVLSFRNTLTKQYVKYFMSELTFGMILMNHITGGFIDDEDQEVLKIVTIMNQDFIISYINHKVLMSNAKTHNELLDFIFCASPPGFFHNIVMGRAHQKMGLDIPPQTLM